MTATQFDAQGRLRHLLTLEGLPRETLLQLLDRAEGKRKRRDAELLDAVAAAVIVERWLAAPQDATVIP